MRTLRRVHLYLGVFFTPAILLFSLSGAAQAFRLHEAKGWGSAPPKILVWMASAHIDQRLPKAEKPDPSKPAKPVKPFDPTPQLPLKLFTGLLGLLLSASTILGIAIAVGTRSTRTVSLVMLAVGALVPLAMLYT